jgi:hypothetical protein
MITWAENIGWGAGSTFQTAASTRLMQAGLADDEYTLLRQILQAATQEMRKTHTFDLEEFLGAQGPRGIQGPPGIPGLPGIGTSYIPTTQMASSGYTPAPRLYQNSQRGTTTYNNVSVVWSQLAQVNIFSASDIDATGWAQVYNGGAGAIVLTIWMSYRPDGDAVGTGTTVGDEVSLSIPAGATRTLRTRAAFTITSASSELYYLDLYGKLDVEESLLSITANHYGITGRGVFQRDSG